MHYAVKSRAHEGAFVNHTRSQSATTDPNLPTAHQHAVATPLSYIASIVPGIDLWWLRRHSSPPGRTAELGFDRSFSIHGIKRHRTPVEICPRSPWKIASPQKNTLPICDQR